MCKLAITELQHYWADQATLEVSKRELRTATPKLCLENRLRIIAFISSAKNLNSSGQRIN